MVTKKLTGKIVNNHQGVLRSGFFRKKANAIVKKTDMPNEIYKNSGQIK